VFLIRLAALARIIEPLGNSGRADPASGGGRSRAGQVARFALLNAGSLSSRLSTNVSNQPGFGALQPSTLVLKNKTFRRERTNKFVGKSPHFRYFLTQPFLFCR